MWISEFKDYKSFLRAVIGKFPKEGRGQFRKLAEYMRVEPIVISQILSRDRHLTQDQSTLVAEYFGFDEPTTEYFIFLVHLARAETNKLKSFYERKLIRIREESENIKNLVKGREELSEIDKGTYYSNWYYSGVYILCAIKGFQTVDAISDYFGLSRGRVAEILSFLASTGLCTEKNGEYRPATMAIHVDADSYFVNNHRRNWREKAKEKFAEPGPKDLFYSSAVSISKHDAEQFRKSLLELIKNFSDQVEPSKEEIAMCLNIDWFEF